MENLNQYLFFINKFGNHFNNIKTILAIESLNYVLSGDSDGKLV